MSLGIREPRFRVFPTAYRMNGRALTWTIAQWTRKWRPNVDAYAVSAVLRSCCIDFQRCERDNAKTEHSADISEAQPTRRSLGDVPRSELVEHELGDLVDMLPYDVERELYWSRVRGNHLRRGGTVRWIGDTFVLEPGVAGVTRGVTRTGDA